MNVKEKSIVTIGPSTALITFGNVLVSIEESKSFSLDFPYEPSQSILSVDFGDASSFVQGAFPTYLASPLSTHEGNHIVIVTVKDLLRSPSQYMSSFQIQVQKSPA